MNRMFFNLTTTMPTQKLRIVTPIVKIEIINLRTTYHFNSKYKNFIR